MKNIFKTNLPIPKNVNIFLKENFLFIKGPLGSSCLDISFFKKKSTEGDTKKYYSLFFRLFQKRLLGVCLNFVVRLKFVGIGFRVESITNSVIRLKLGFSHLVLVPKPDYINIFVPDKTILVVECINDQLLKQFCAQIQALKSPDAYKGKGILYKNQILILKEGKKK